MKLPTPKPPLDLTAMLEEFDIWITPTLGEIRDTERFEHELRSVTGVFDALADTTKGFGQLRDCSPEAISEALLRLVAGKPEGEATDILLGAASLLFLATGKSDNNAKCQLPLHLRDKARWTSFPVLRRKKHDPVVEQGSIPRVLPSERYMPLVASLQKSPLEQHRLLLEFVRFVLSDERYVAQLWSIGHSYVRMKAFKQERNLLTPLVIFQVRGSVSASGGHDPERRMRTIFEYLGLVAGVDYNTVDVVVSGDRLIPVDRKVGEEDEIPPSEGETVEVVVKVEGKSKKKKVKTRAYDFVLPYQTPGWGHRVFVQSQFYAGDSGSVSYKNVDQTSTSRVKVLQQYESPLFVEYVDGAGYFSSLNGDLRSLLSMEDTHSFVQVRSAPIRIRRVLQEIGFCTPMELEHAVARTDGALASVLRLLVKDGYKKKEVERCIGVSLKQGFVARQNGGLALNPDRRKLARRFFLLDTIAAHGTKLQGSADAGFLLVPGYGPFFGMKKTDMLKRAIQLSPGFARDFSDSATLLEDIQWLEEQKYTISS